MSLMLTGSEILMEVLLEQGVDLLFGYPGGAVLNLYDALYAYQDKITHILTAHEQGACHAADGYARATGETGVVLATSGPGATNLVTGIATAYMDSIPLVAITGNVGTSLIGRDSFQEVYIAGITMPITKHNFVVRRVEELAGILRAAFLIAQSGRKGPVLVDLPKDVSAAKCAFTHAPPPEFSALQPVLPPAAAIQTAADLIQKAQRPVIYFGGGISHAGAGEALRALAETAQIPATHTLMAAGVLGYDHPLNLGLIGMHGNLAANHAVHDADLLLILGARLSDRVALNPARFAHNATRVHVDIDAAEVNKNVPMHLSLVGDAKHILEALLPQITPQTHPVWLEQIKRWQEQQPKPQNDPNTLRPHEIMHCINELATDAIYVTDVGQHQLWAAQYARHLRPRSFLTSGGLGTMGFGYGAAIGAALSPEALERPVIHITGDGSFHMNLQEACTAVSYQVPVITVIFNNQVLGMVRQWQAAFYGKRYAGTDPARATDFVQVAQGFGLPGFRCTNLAEFQEVFAQALALSRTGTPVWIECIVDKDERVLPMIPAGGTIDDMILD